MPTCKEHCDNGCEALEGLYEKAAALIPYSDLINAWLNGPATGTVVIAGVSTPTLLNLVTTLQKRFEAFLTASQGRVDAFIITSQGRIDSLITTSEGRVNALITTAQNDINSLITSYNNLLTTYENRIKNIPQSIIKPNGGIYIDNNGLLYIDPNDFNNTENLVQSLSQILKPNGGLAFDANNKLYVEDAGINLNNIIQPNSGLAIKDDKIYLDFNNIPQDKFADLLKSLQIKVRLTANKAFYVSLAQGSDTIVDGIGETIAKAFKTIGACIRYVTNNYDIGDYQATIYILDGTYYERIILPSYSRNSGKIRITSYSNDHEKVVLVNTQVNASTVTVNGGNWIIDNLTIDFRPDLSLANGTVIVGLIVASGGSTELTLIDNLYRVAPEGTGTHSYRFRAIQASQGAQIALYPGIYGNHLDTGFVPSTQIQVYILVAYLQGIITAVGTDDANQKPGLEVNAQYDVFAVVDGGKLRCASGNTYPPKFTNLAERNGKRYQCQNGGSIESPLGTGGNFLPGYVNGTVEDSTYSWVK